MKEKLAFGNKIFINNRYKIINEISLISDIKC